MRTVLLLRHAKSSWDSGAADDFDRPLAPRGERDAPRMGKALKTAGLQPDLVVASPAKRARQTAELFVKESGFRVETVHDERIYAASVTDLLAVLSGLPDSVETVLLVGHNPGFEELLGELCGTGDDPARFQVPTACLACVDLDGDGWGDAAPGAGTLRWMLIPKIL